MPHRYFLGLATLCLLLSPIAVSEIEYVLPYPAFQITTGESSLPYWWAAWFYLLAFGYYLLRGKLSNFCKQVGVWHFITSLVFWIVMFYSPYVLVHLHPEIASNLFNFIPTFYVLTAGLQILFIGLISRILLLARHSTNRKATV